MGSNLFVCVCLSGLDIRYTTLLLLVACCASGAIGKQIVQEDHLGKHNHEHNANMFLGSEVSTLWFIITVIKPASFYQLTITVFQNKDEIQKLSPSDQRKRLVEIVKKIDTNSDKYLTPGQFWFDWL